MTYRSIEFSVRQADGAWEYLIPPNALFKIKVQVGGFASQAAAVDAAKDLIDDWYISV